jgi:hypothetical protein
VSGWATISPNGRYRYLLGRRLADDGGRMLFVMLNPSTADADTDDATIRRCVGYARREGCGILEVVNLFAWRTVSPGELATVVDPVGPDNDRHIREAAARAGPVVVAWGNPPFRLTRAAERAALVAGMLDRYWPLALGTTSTGQPVHPLRQRADAPLRPWGLL